MAARKGFPVKVRRVAVTNKKTGVKYIEERRYTRTISFLESR